jgi:para-aminobenzoate synthetase component 1
MRGNIELAVRKLDWKISTLELFSQLSHLPWAILLDSGRNQSLNSQPDKKPAPHPDAKADIIAFNPIATLVTQGDDTQFTALDESVSFLVKNPKFKQESIKVHHGTNGHSKACPFELLGHYHRKLYPVSFECPLPFSGGALGSFSYDLGRRLEKLPNTAMKDIHLNEMNIGFYDFCLIYDHSHNTWHAVHYLGIDALDDAMSKLEARLNAIDASVGKLETDVLSAPVKQADFKLVSDWQCQIPKAAYLAKFEQVQQYLLSGDCYQINLTQRFSAQYQGDEWQAYCALTQANSAPFSAFMRLENHSILSISPERFIRLAGTEISTKPIKGTLPRGKTAAEDELNAKRLQHSEKDRAENVMIVDLLRNDISKVALPGSVAVPHLFTIESFPAVHHLVSTVTAKINPNYSATDLLQAAFPGGSITGAPKIRAMEIIEELEPSRRSLYCGSMGYISQDGNMDTSITIRTLVAEKATKNGDSGTLYCWAGGGIVADSNGEDEYQESFDKVSKILPILSQY